MTAIYTQALHSSHIARLLCAAFLLLPILVSNLNAQVVPEDSDLYFPPKLKVEAFASDETNPRRAQRDRSKDDERREALGESTTSAITLASRYQPAVEAILPMVFFDGAGSIAIPERYQTFYRTSQTDEYTDSGDVLYIRSDSKTKYYEVLNIIGYRMNQFPESWVELEGCYSTLPGEDPDVGTGRAEVIRDYLTSIWHLAPERILLRPARQACDSSDHILRQAEAQRVIIMASDWRLVQPVQYFQVRPEDIFIYFSFTIDPSMSPEEVAGIEIVLNAGDQLLCRAEVSGHPDSSLYRLQGIWPAFGLRSQGTDALTVRAMVRNTSGVIRNAAPVRIPIGFDRTTSRLINREEYFELIDFTIPFFEARDSTLSTLQQRYLDVYLDSLFSGEDVTWTDYELSLRGDYETSEDAGINLDILSLRSSIEDLRERTISRLFSSIEQPIVFFDGTGRIDDVILRRTWLGEEYLQQAREIETQEVLNPYGSYVEDPWLDTLATARANRVKEYLRHKLEAQGILDVHFDDEYPHHSSEGKPENRYYQRSVNVRLQRIYQAEATEEFEFDGFEEDSLEEPVQEE